MAHQYTLLLTAESLNVSNKRRRLVFPIQILLDVGFIILVIYIILYIILIARVI
jgi:hypothetical protein